jgi:protein-S-isoprenylcysteine O-methyltransferase Ste14
MSSFGTVWLALRSLLWTLLLPGVMAGFIPWRYLGVSRAHIDWQNPRQLAALVLIAAGVALLATCIWEFARSGRGTLSPVDPPKHLVVRGLYRYVRNPMYLAVSLIVLGEALLIASLDLLLYWGFFFGIVNLFVIGYEEPTLRAQFGAEYDEYTRRVGRWLPSFRR